MTTATPRPHPLSDGALAERSAVTDFAPQHTLPRSILLHLLPGVAILAAYVVIEAVTAPLGFPAAFALLLAALIAGIPSQLGHLLYLGRRRNGSWSLEGVTLLRAPLRPWQYAVWTPLLLIWAYLCYGLATPVSDFLSRSVFSWLPIWFFRDDFTHTSRPILLLTLALLLVVNGLIGPAVEEAYFRGYLLPRLSRLGPWAPVINLALFTLYHLWQPWLYPTLLLALAPMIFAVWRTRSVRLGIVTHSALNLIGGALSVALLLGGR